MKFENILVHLRKENNLTQEELAERLCVTRQAVSRWETGETMPNIDTLQQISELFGIPINTLLGSPQQLFCQCCGMPLSDSSFSQEPDGTQNQEYCKWCYHNGVFTYPTMQSLLDFLLAHYSNPDLTKKENETLLKKQLLSLKHWQSNS